MHNYGHTYTHTHTHTHTPAPALYYPIYGSHVLTSQEGTKEQDHTANAHIAY